MRFVAQSQGEVPGSTESKAHIKMFMRADSSKFGNRMDIEIEGYRTDQFQICQPGFFFHLSSGDGLSFSTAIRMPAGLKPSIEFSVMDHGNLGTLYVGYPG